MSDDSDSSEDNQSEGFISRITSSSSEYIELLNELRGGADELDVDDQEELDFIVRPSAQEVAEEAYFELRDRLDDPSNIPFDNPRAVLFESERQFARMRNQLVHEVERIREKEEGSVTGADIDTMLYIVEKNSGKTGQFTLFGGAESLIRNTGEKYDWHPMEVELIIIANEIAARENNLHRHLLLDKVLIVPNSEDVVYNKT